MTIHQHLVNMIQNEQKMAPPPELVDSELLMRFVRHREQEAFEHLVGKYAAMVLGVCTQILRDRHEAEDVFQATFLILAQRADKIQKASSVGPWLYKVAYRSAVRVAKERQQRLRRHETETSAEIEATEVEQWSSIAAQEEQTALHEELTRLPQRYREPLVLCYLQGLSHTEAANELELTLGVVNGRMTRGKQLLRVRLLRRGIALSLVLATSSASVSASQAASISSLLSVTTKVCAATVLHGSSSIFSTNIGAIAQQGVLTMKITLVPRFAAAATLLAATLFALSFLDGSGEPYAALTIVQAAAAVEPQADVGVVLVADGNEGDEPEGVQKIDVDLLVGSEWKHSYEEDKDFEGRIFRPADSKKWPPSRFRNRYVFNKDGTCKALYLHPADAHRMVSGKWEIDSENPQVIHLTCEKIGKRSLEVLELTDKIMRVKR